VIESAAESRKTRTINQREVKTRFNQSVSTMA
jgi:hypothetical protein